MPGKKPPSPRKTGFSRQFDDALIDTLLTDAMVNADGWSLAQFVDAPHWLQQVYNRHAKAAYREMQRIEESENALQPSEHK
jgi:hypothetical protein